MKIQTRRGFRATRNATVAVAAVAGLVLGSAGAAGAEVNDQNRIVSNGHEVIVTQEDTFINGVPPIGGSPLSREWFHNGRGLANIVGPEAADFEGSTFQFGYQVAWSASVDGSVGFSWMSPDVEIGLFPTVTPEYKEIQVPVLDGQGQLQYVDKDGKPVPPGTADAVLKTETAYEKIKDGGKPTVDTEIGVYELLPQATATVELTPAPGIEEIVVAEGQFDGDFKEVQIANVHGAATGVIGPVSLRPFVRVITANGDNVTTYGQVWTL